MPPALRRRVRQPLRRRSQIVGQRLGQWPSTTSSSFGDRRFLAGAGTATATCTTGSTSSAFTSSTSGEVSAAAVFDRRNLFDRRHVPQPPFLLLQLRTLPPRSLASQFLAPQSLACHQPPARPRNGQAQSPQPRPSVQALAERAGASGAATGGSHWSSWRRRAGAGTGRNFGNTPHLEPCVPAIRALHIAPCLRDRVLGDFVLRVTVRANQPHIRPSKPVFRLLVESCNP